MTLQTDTGALNLKLSLSALQNLKQGEQVAPASAHTSARVVVG